MQQEKTDIKSMNLDELKSYMESIGENRFVPNSYISGCMKNWQHPLMK